jgi:hypothetical protein
MLYGVWADDLRDRIGVELRSVERQEAWGEPDTTGNLFAPVCKALATLYTPDPPRVTHPEAAGVALAAEVEAAGLWDVMIRGQRDAIGMREWLVHVDALRDPATVTGWRLVYRPVFVDRVVCYPRGDAPDLPGYVCEWRRGTFDGGPERWYRWAWDVRGAIPTFTLTDDETGAVVFVRSGAEYAAEFGAVDSLGRPIVPFSLYHAERTGHLWDPYEWSDVVEGSLRLGVYWTFFGHLIRNASWPQRWAMGAFVGGEVSESTEDVPGYARSPIRRYRVPADPSMLLTLTVDPDTTFPPQVGAFPPGSDPDKVATAIGTYERRVAGITGIDPASIRRDSGDPRSGYAITVSRDAQKEYRTLYRPAFERGDRETLRISAAVLHSRSRIRFPETGYAIEYGPPEVARLQSETITHSREAATGLIETVEAVSAGRITHDSARTVLRLAYRLPDDEIESLLAGVEVRPPPVIAPPGASPQTQTEDPDDGR